VLSTDCFCNASLERDASRYLWRPADDARAQTLDGIMSNRLEVRLPDLDIDVVHFWTGVEEASREQHGLAVCRVMTATGLWFVGSRLTIIAGPKKHVRLSEQHLVRRVRVGTSKVG